MKTKARIIAFYLPQYHPIPENDEWWGKGFTEWTNVGKAKSLFNGHYQPRVPADLGYYDLRLPETRKAQADLAKEHGVEGFCYWHYWFGYGKQLIERPFNEVLKSGDPDFPFCLAWANESWKGFDHGLKNRNVLIEQLYPGEEDYIEHFYTVLPAFKDSRYLKIDNKPIFMIYRPLANDEIKIFIKVWRKLALENGLKGIYFIGHLNQLNYSIDDILLSGVDGVNTTRLANYNYNYQSVISKLINKFYKILLKKPYSFSYELMSKYFIEDEIDKIDNVYPSIIPGWDHSPRSGVEGLIMTNSTPELFEKHVKHVVELVEKKNKENRLIFLKSWNEWAEGNYVEPDLKWGDKFLKAIKRQVLIF
jgi:hypothetical protein